MLYMVSIDSRMVLVSDWTGTEGWVVNGAWSLQVDYDSGQARPAGKPWVRFSQIKVVRVPPCLWGLEYNAIFEWFERGGGAPDEIARIYEEHKDDDDD